MNRFTRIVRQGISVGALIAAASLSGCSGGLRETLEDHLLRPGEAVTLHPSRWRDGIVIEYAPNPADAPNDKDCLYIWPEKLANRSTLRDENRSAGIGRNSAQEGTVLKYERDGVVYELTIRSITNKGDGDAANNVLYLHIETTPGH